MPTLYRKYRPQTFHDVTGQAHIIQTISNEIATGHVAQAYLFSGPRGVGKTTTARLLAKAVNCENRKEGNFEPCEECTSCKEITGGRNIDVIEIDAASQTGVDNVRENIIENAQFKPTKSKHKVFIIDEVHMLSNSSFNALLKTLEEPPAHIIFILATTELHKLPDTVISRCQRFNFKKIKHEEMLKRLGELIKEEKKEVSQDVLERIINKSDGCMRDAESLLGQILSLNLDKITAEDAQMILPTSNAESILNFIKFLVEEKPGEAIDFINKLAETGINLDQFAHDLLEILRLMMIGQSGASINFNTDYSQEAYKTIKELSTKFSGEKIIALIEKTIIRKAQIRTSPIPQLPLELLIVEFGSKQNSTPIVVTTQKVQPNVAPPVVENKTIPVAKIETPFASKTVVATPEKAVVYEAVHKHDVTATFEQVKEKWPAVMKKLSETNHSLIFILKTCKLKELDGNCLRITAPFGLHKDKVEEIKNKKCIDDCLTEFLGEDLHISCTVENAEETKKKEEAEITNLAAEFGGVLV